MRRRLVLAAAVPLLAARSALAQPDACRAAIPADSLHPVIVSLAPRLIDSSARAAEPTVHLFADATAERVRAALGAGPGQLPDGSARLRWWESDGAVSVVLRRGGGFAVDVHDVRNRELPLLVAVDTAGAALVARAARQAFDSTGPYFWDESVPGDSLRFVLDLVPSGTAPDGSRVSHGRPIAFPVFSQRVPAETPVAPLPEQSRSPRYPAGAKRDSFIGTVVLQFIVDTAGRAVPGSIRDVWPEHRPRLEGESAQAYREFVDASRAGVRGMRFRPATIGGCKVPQLVVEPFEYRLIR
ncbi:hypothetical protein [Roseisolibacter sp. H3M3-2]|uniref:hypothetical protein n=1 Tax=Roseisolibacter sp. H3M3-2 TaxID=3031323 RepID=UPI0023DCABCF|nr:hypothetical protein [Roseisolibacter sp. H3M3-2]MDF1502609.1 hypothetical protein [Roseisolibacter sp. H3M3-2]